MGVAEKLAAAMALEEYAEKLLDDDAFPIIVIGKSAGDYHLYSSGAAPPDLVAETLIRMAVGAVGAGGFFRLLEERAMEGPDE